jgi:PAS domain S-box-containing protein
MAAILIVDEDRAGAAALEASLRRMGHEVLVARSALRALELAAVRRPDVVLLDIELDGELDGIQCAHVLKERHRVPIVYVTAQIDPESIARTAATEPAGHVLKPVHHQHLHGVIEIALYKHEMDSRLRERERWLSSALRSLEVPVIAVDRAEHIRLVNAAAEELLGCREEQVRGGSLGTIDLGAAEELVGRAMNERHTTLRPVEVARDGRARAISATVTPIVDAADRVQGAILILETAACAERRALLATSAPQVS